MVWNEVLICRRWGVGSRWEWECNGVVVIFFNVDIYIYISIYTVYTRVCVRVTSDICLSLAWVGLELLRSSPSCIRDVHATSQNIGGNQGARTATAKMPRVCAVCVGFPPSFFGGGLSTLWPRGVWPQEVSCRESLGHSRTSPILLS